MTVITRTQYLKEFGKLLAGMAARDRESVLAKYAVMFDEADGDDALIAKLGSPTASAVRELRGYVPSEEPDTAGGGEEPRDEAAPDGEAPVESAAPETAEDTPAPALDADGEAEPPAACAETPDEPEIVPAGADDSARPLPDNASPSVGERPDTPEDEPEIVDEPDGAEESVNDAPDEEAGHEGLVAPEHMPEPLEQPAPVEEEHEGLDVPAPEDGASVVDAPEEAPEPSEHSEDDTPDELDDFPDIEALIEEGVLTDEETPEPPPVAPRFVAAQAVAPKAAPIVPAAPMESAEAGGVPAEARTEAAPDKPELLSGRLILYILFGLVLCLPATVLLVCLTVAILGAGAAAVAAGIFTGSLCFLGITIFADVLLLCGAGLIMAALGLLLLFFGVWFFLRCVIGFVNLILRTGGVWCRKQEVSE